MFRRMMPYVVVLLLVLTALLFYQVENLRTTVDGLATAGEVEESSAAVAQAASEEDGSAASEDTAVAVVDTGDEASLEEENVGENLALEEGEAFVSYGVPIGGDTILHGDPTTAAVVMVEFSDFECPFCGAVFPTIQALGEMYGDDLAVVYKDFPVSSMHSYAQVAAEAAECADEQGAFVAYHDILFTNQGALDEASLKQYAVDLGLDTESFGACLDSGSMKDEVLGDYGDGLAIGIRGTPGFSINGEFVYGAQSQAVFEEIIDSSL